MDEWIRSPSKKSLEENVTEWIMRQVVVSEGDAKNMAKGLISGKIPYIQTPTGRIAIR
jgi:hypothetical protein